MRNAIKRTVYLISSIVLVMNTSCDKNVEKIYVSTKGKDNNNGTKNSPLLTIAGASAKMMELKSSEDMMEKRKYEINFMEGTYYFSHTHALNNSDGGSPESPVCYRSYKKEKVVFSGGIELDHKDFKPVVDNKILNRILDHHSRTHILYVNLKKKGITNYGKLRQHGFSIAILPAPMELFIDGEPMTIARYPNEGRLPVADVVEDCSKAIQGDFTARPGIIKYDYNRADYWGNAEDAWLWGYFAAGFADDNLGVASIDTINNTIALKNAHMFGMIPTDTTDEWGGRIVGYYAYNILEEIDMPGEYYIDRENGMLYLYPPENFENSKICLSNLADPILAIENSSNILFEGITFENAKGMGVYLENSQHVEFKNCIFRNLGTVAVMFGKGVTGADYPIHEFTGFLKSRTVGNLKAHVYENTGFYNKAGQHCGLTKCSIYNTGTGAVILSGGERRLLKAGKNFVQHCDIHDFNRWNKTYCAGITLYGVGNIIRNNHIYNAPHQGIAVFGNEHLIELNHMEKLVMDVHDNGAVYIGRNPSERGNIIRNNYFSEMGQQGFKNCAIHLDDFASATLVEGNIFYKASKFDFGDILINGGSDNIIRNNVFIQGSHVLWIENPNMAIPEDLFNSRYGYNGLMGKRMFQDINIESEQWRKMYPDFQPYSEDKIPFVLKGNEFYRNMIICDEFIISKHDLNESVFVEYHDNYFVKEDNIPEKLNPRRLLSAENIILDGFIPGFDTIPFFKVGPRIEEFNE